VKKSKDRLFVSKISIADVADTAYWVAGIRAQETARPDAVFKDALASAVAGPRGMRIARSMPNSAITHWGVVLRTSAIDRLIEDAVRRGVHTFVNLGAGLDTRPYRMQLPPHTRWIEIDFADLVQLKNAVLWDYTPTCRIERIGLNLLDREARRDALAAYASQDGRSMLIAEGVIPYLSNEEAASLAKELSESFQYWILDFDNSGGKTPRTWARQLKASPFLFQPNDWFDFFEQCGWCAQQVITSAAESERLNRRYPFVFPRGVLMRALPRAMRQQILGLSGAALMGISRGR
jgi:methyltransferase (TIGR00027 family)